MYHPFGPRGRIGRENERWKAESDKERGEERGMMEVRGREISALGISETSLARVTSRPFRRKFKFHGTEVVTDYQRAGIRKQSFVCASNVQTDDVPAVYIHMSEDMSLDERERAWYRIHEETKFARRRDMT